MKKTKRVHVVSFFDEKLASFRLRQLMIAEKINSMKDCLWSVTISEKPDIEADINLFLKHQHQDTILTWMQQINMARVPTRILFDMSDYHFDKPNLKDYYEDVLKLVDGCVTSNEPLTDFVREKAENQIPCWTIYEPTQLSWVTDEHRNNPDRKGVVWFGSKTNLETLLPHIDKYGDELTIFSDVKIEGLNCKEWYLGCEKELLNYKKVLLPQTSIYKSPNRLVDAIVAGCEVETFGAECYKRFESLLQSPSLVKSMFSLDTIVSQWIDVFDQLLDNPKRKVVKKVHNALVGKPVVKLNIGCWTKIYPKSEGWVNVDGMYNKGVDVVTDVRKLSPILGLEVADELHAYHVVEHFYPKELPAILKDWNLVLKSGGKICLEAPDFLKCAKNILQLETSEDYDMWYELGLKGFYGDYEAVYGKPEHVLHKWAYTFKTLKPILEKAGFVDIEEQRPLTHREHRDFRLIGYKK